MNDDGYLLLALADDFRAAFPVNEPLDPDDAYDWLVAKAEEIGSDA